MSRAKGIWIAFCACVAVVLTAMGWVSFTALRLDRERADAQYQTRREEHTSLALWRLDAALMPLIAQESARPYFLYAPGTWLRSGLAQGGRRNELLSLAAGASPRLPDRSPFILRHFVVDPAGQIAAPRWPGQAAPSAGTAAAPDSRPAVDRQLDWLRSNVEQSALLAELAGPPLSVSQSQPTAPSPRWTSRRHAIVNTSATLVQRQQFDNLYRAVGELYANVQEAPARSLWVRGALILARRVEIGPETYIVGSWLNWRAIRAWMQQEIRDLLPSARLEPAPPPGSVQESRMLASLPVQLVPGTVPGESAGWPGPVGISLAIAWACLLVAAAAVAGLLRGTLSLSERRGAFVSAVTHELRTPLTALRMYTEMLADGMVVEEQKRRQYLATVCEETHRLCRLVENVLAYSRLEGRRQQVQKRPVDLHVLVEQIGERLRQRAEQAGMELLIEGDRGREPAMVETDSTAVEQVLFNLVDNACKYAARARDRRIHVEASAGPRAASICVRDHGPGVSREEKARIFRPFQRAARGAAGSAGGAGLGLAISRRLARSLGGDLRIDAQASEGARFCLTLPRKPNRTG